MHCNKSKYSNATLVNPNNNEREREILHSSTDNRNVTRKNNSPEYLRLEILHSVHYTRKTQNSDDANTRRYTPFPSSLSSSRFPPTLWESYTTYIYIYMLALFCIMHIGATRHGAWLHHYLRLKSIPFHSFRWRGRASTESFTLPTTISSPLCGRQARKYSARQTKSRNVARAFRLTDNFPSAERAPTTCVIIVNGRKECGGREGNGLADGRTLDMDEERFGILEYN